MTQGPQANNDITFQGPSDYLLEAKGKGQTTSLDQTELFTYYIHFCTIALFYGCLPVIP